MQTRKSSNNSITPHFPFPPTTNPGRPVGTEDVIYDVPTQVQFPAVAPK